MSKKKTSALHSSADGNGTNEHYTDPEIIDKCRLVVGDFDVDPFSCELANRDVRAKTYYTKPEDPNRGGGFDLPWNGVFFCNPPGGKWKGMGNQKRAWHRAMNEYEAGRSKGGVYICFSMEFLQVVQEPEGEQVILSVTRRMLPHHFPILYPARRLRYRTDKLPGPTEKYPDRKPTPKQIEDMERTGLCFGESPTHASCIILVPNPDDQARQIDLFCAVFSSIGEIVVPRRFGYG